MLGVNKVIVLGNLGTDPELRYTRAGAPVTNLRLATHFRFTDRTGRRREQTEWHHLVLYGRDAELAARHLSRGSTAYFEGRLHTRPWTRHRATHYRTEIIVAEMRLVTDHDPGIAMPDGLDDPGRNG